MCLLLRQRGGAASGGGVEERVNFATVLTKLVDKSERNLSQARIMDLARRNLADLDHLKISVEVVPRVSGYDPGVNHATFGIEKRAGGHTFQLNFSNSFRFCDRSA